VFMIGRNGMGMDELRWGGDTRRNFKQKLKWEINKKK